MPIAGAPDGMPAAVATSKLEEAWAEMADGLHIQRYFLDTRPAKIKRIERLCADCGVSAERLAEIRSSVPDGLLEHLLDERQPTPLERAVEGLRFAEFAASLAGAAILIVPESACVAGAAPLVDRRALPGAAQAHDPSFVDAVSAALETAAVGYFPALNTRVVVESAAAGSAPDFFAPRDLLLETVVVPADSTPYAYAEDLAARSAARFWFSFLLSRPDPTLPPPHLWRSPWCADSYDTISMATDVMAKSIRLRMRERVLRHAPELLTAAERESCKASVPDLRHQLLSVESFVDGIETILAAPSPAPVPEDNNMDVGDLLCTLHPGRNQYHKYWEGGCAGQS